MSDLFTNKHTQENRDVFLRSLVRLYRCLVGGDCVVAAVYNVQSGKIHFNDFFFVSHLGFVSLLFLSLSWAYIFFWPTTKFYVHWQPPLIFAISIFLVFWLYIVLQSRKLHITCLVLWRWRGHGLSSFFLAIIISTSFLRITYIPSCVWYTTIVFLANQSLR